VESPVLTRVQNSTYHLDHFSGGLPNNLPLLTIGDDFAKTDVLSVL